MPIPFSAVLLAAGRSTRMGQDKALLHAHNAPLWQRQRDILAAAGASEIFLNVRPEQAWAFEAPDFTALLHDAYPDCGPIMGLTAGLERASHSHVAVLAIDLPELPAQWFLQLLQECGPSIGAIGRRAGSFEPLAAIYPTEMKWLAWETIAAGDYSVQRLVAAAEKNGLVRVHEITDAEAGWFKNWNEP